MQFGVWTACLDYYEKTICYYDFFFFCYTVYVKNACFYEGDLTVQI